MINRHSVRGFTVIEVILFLALSGMLLAGILVGISGSIDRERYDDAVSTTADFIRSEYALVDDVHNDRSVSEVPGCGSSRGASSCVLMGRIIWSNESDGGKKVHSAAVVATRDVRNSAVLGVIDDSTKSDKDILDAMGLRRIQSATTTASGVRDFSIPWDMSVNYSVGLDSPSATPTGTFGLLIVRSPRTGVYNTYQITSGDIIGGGSNEIKSHDLNDTTQAAVLCIVDNGGIVARSSRGVRIASHAVNVSAVQETTDDGRCGG